MNYGELLFKAHENHKNTTTKNVPCYKTSFSPPKKLGRPTVLSENIKKFLAKKEEEEKKKNLEARKKKAELLALRSQDKKAQKRVQVMLKRTKSANKSVMEDAIDNVNTRDTLDGPMQCDEDDYGYVSQEASAFYAKMMNKYENMPAEPSIFSKSKREVKDLAAAKDRVKAALRKEEEESELPHKRKRKKGEESGEGDKKSPNDKEKNENSYDKHRDDKYKENDKRKDSDSDKNKEEKKKPKKSAPPTINFDELLKLAEVKQHQPIIIETPSAPKEPERLMTQKEKEEFLKEEERKRNRNRRPLNSDVSSKDSPQTQKHSKSSIESSSISKKPEMSKKPISKDKDMKDKVYKSKSNEQDKLKVSSTERIRKEVNPLEKSNNNNNYINHKVVPKPSKSLGEKDRSTKPSDSKHIDKNVIRKGGEKGNVDSTLLDIDREIELLKKKRMLLASSGNNKQNPAIQKLKMVDNKDRLNSNKPQMKPTEMKSIDKKPDKINSGKMPNLKTKKSLEKMKSKKRRIDSDSEYDSELDDFIDDGPEEMEDYSKYISEIFGYDKSKYRDMDDGDECMESNFAQQMREEYVSTKIGILEDLEDIQKEQEEKKRLKKKRLK
ncbi:protein SPT2 homolog [Cimex lectularius]|uniref:Protein SPT2 homolog n=1 Tax=Cimex lectularius TaxID=79782 RepID=A0A8I6SVK0_CIMLE|nr:protein SPT2 homolog [Cimex lectularius]XP_024086194.1 protein SPT2 homolog [Cimex lectularius]XP_024086195.1 protein SPT2 homolog [Cimex lectularius]